MDPGLQRTALILLFLALWVGWRITRSRKMRRKMTELRSQGVQIVDVRSPEEFAGGSNPESINIPLDHLEQELARLDPARPVVLCCASGMRSQMAMMLLKQNGFKDVVNAGAWTRTVG
jgi:phage shock protein E